MRDFLKTFFGVGYVSSPVSDARIDWAWRLCMQASRKATLACAGAFATTDFRPDLPAFHVPTLVVHGTGDQTVPDRRIWPCGGQGHRRCAARRI